MDDFETSASTREIIKDKLRQNFDGKIVRKDLTKKIKEGANVPTYVLEFLLGQYCSSDDDEIIQKGVENVKRILADNYVRPDEAEKVLSKLRQRGAMTIIDQVTVELNLRYDYYEARFSNLGLGGVPIDEEYPEKAEILTKASGVTLGELVSIDYNWGELHLYSPTRYEMEDDCLMKISAAPTAMDIEPDDIDVSDSVTFVWEIR